MNWSALVQLIAALYKGKELLDAEGWKKRAAATAILSSILSALVTFLVVSGWVPATLITPDTIVAISGGLASIGFVVLGYFQIATSSRVGKLPHPRDGGVQLDNDLSDSARPDEPSSDPGGSDSSPLGNFKPE